MMTEVGNTVFEEYQFLRYFIPGSLFVMYTTLVFLPNLSKNVVSYILEKPDSLLGIVGAAFGASLAFGYIIYSVFDTLLYNPIALKNGWRKVLSYMESKIDTEVNKKVWRGLNKEKKKEFLEMLFLSLGDAEKTNRFLNLFMECGHILLRELLMDY
jgi:hypothetical protein